MCDCSISKLGKYASVKYFEIVMSGARDNVHKNGTLPFEGYPETAENKQINVYK